MFDEVTELQEQHGHEFSGEHTLTQYDPSLVLCAFSLHIIPEVLFWVIVVSLKLFRMMPMQSCTLSSQEVFSPYRDVQQFSYCSTTCSDNDSSSLYSTTYTGPQ